MEISIIKFLQSASNPFYDFIFIFVSELASYKGFLITFAIFFIFCFLLLLLLFSFCKALSTAFLSLEEFPSVFFVFTPTAPHFSFRVLPPSSRQSTDRQRLRRGPHRSRRGSFRGLCRHLVANARNCRCPLLSPAGGTTRARRNAEVAS